MMLPPHFGFIHIGYLREDESVNLTGHGQFVHIEDGSVDNAALNEWLRDHGIDPEWVSFAGPIKITMSAIEYIGFVHNDLGLVIKDNKLTLETVKVDCRPRPLPELTNTIVTME
jgi:hypothetical protein